VLSDIYESVFLDNDDSDTLEEALISRAPKQKGFFSELGTRTGKFLGNKTSNIKLQILDKYHEVWADFIREWKSNKRIRKATNKGKGFPVSFIINYLEHIGITDSDDVAKQLGYSTSSSTYSPKSKKPTKSTKTQIRDLDREQAGKLIFSSIENHYGQQNLSKPTTSYRIQPLNIP
jgi:hypothetical protein